MSVDSGNEVIGDTLNLWAWREVSNISSQKAQVKVIGAEIQVKLQVFFQIMSKVIKSSINCEREACEALWLAERGGAVEDDNLNKVKNAIIDSFIPSYLSMQSIA